MKKGPSEGGNGGKRGHSNMEHWGYTDEVKEFARRRRRLDAKKIIALAKAEHDATEPLDSAAESGVGPSPTLRQ